MSNFIDQVRIRVRSGDGGNGIVAWRREKYEPLGGPAGGNGGRGGHVYLEADPDMATLIDFRYRSQFQAQNGERGGPKGMHGAHGQDLVIRVPPGTVVRDITSNRVIADLVEPGQRALLAEGGRGGRGNAQLATPTRRAPAYCEPGEPGIERELELELKLIADVGIVGMPNAGKSTLLAAMTRAHPKIADYPFTTLEPNLGVVKTPDGGGYVLADIPGLIRGASQGAGLGDKFLRHIERTRLLIHLADISADFVDAITTVNQELHLYDERLDRLPQIVVLNKSDLVTDEARDKALDEVRRLLKRPGRRPAAATDVLAVSAATRQGLPALEKALLGKLSQLRDRPALPIVEPDSGAVEHRDEGFVVMRRKNVFTVAGDRIERLVSVTDLRNPESLHHLYQVLRSMGVVEALLGQGAQPGCEVVIGRTSFIFGDELL
ncbi:MAG TPA: GTPase ObgE [Candidatus Obscuribacterales bacterium]